MSQARELLAHTHSSNMPGAQLDWRSSPRSGTGNRALDGHPPGWLCLGGVLGGSTGDSINKERFYEASWTCTLILNLGGLQVPPPAVLGISDPSALHQSQTSGRAEYHVAPSVGGYST